MTSLLKTHQKSHLSAAVAQLNVERVPAQGCSLEREGFWGSAVPWLSRNKDPQRILNLGKQKTPEEMGITSNRPGFSQQPSYKIYLGPNTRTTCLD